MLLLDINDRLELDEPVDVSFHTALRRIDQTIPSLLQKSGNQAWNFNGANQPQRLRKMLQAQPVRKLRAMAAAWDDEKHSSTIDAAKQPLRAAINDALRAHEAQYPKERRAEEAMTAAIQAFDKKVKAIMPTLEGARPKLGIDPQAQLINAVIGLDQIASEHLRHLPRNNQLFEATAAGSAQWNGEAMRSYKDVLCTVLRGIPLAKLEGVITNLQEEKKSFDVQRHPVRHLVQLIVDERTAAAAPSRVRIAPHRNR